MKWASRSTLVLRDTQPLIPDHLDIVGSSSFSWHWTRVKPIAWPLPQVCGTLSQFFFLAEQLVGAGFCGWVGDQIIFP